LFNKISQFHFCSVEILCDGELLFVHFRVDVRGTNTHPAVTRIKPLVQSTGPSLSSHPYCNYFLQAQVMTVPSILIPRDSPPPMVKIHL